MLSLGPYTFRFNVLLTGISKHLLLGIGFLIVKPVMQILPSLPTSTVL